MKNVTIFIIACLISAGLAIISDSLAVPELGVSTVLLLWGITVWYFINRQGSTQRKEQG